MSREAFGDPPESQEPPDLCPVCGNDWHAEDCEFGKEVARRLKAERDAHRLAFENEQLRREAVAATLPPAYAPPEPLTHWQTITIDLYVPTSGRCDQHATVIDGERVGLLSATEIGALVRGMVRKRPAVWLQAEIRRDEWASAPVDAP